MPTRTTKDNVTSYRAFGGVAIQSRIAAFFFLWKKIRAAQPVSCINARSPPLRFDFKKFRLEVKKGDIS
ncbi:hypothetical protein [Coprococcus comes]|uniref:hypothetical protein n=1 Tax=Coprococcus comes TaxID=410072 RepID=UPI003F8C1EBB